MPVIGGVLEKSALARFASTLATTFAAGVPLVDALKTVAGATGNVVYEEAVHQIREDVATGHHTAAGHAANRSVPADADPDDRHR
jgi:type IV pilus assembly protein PilC